MANPRKFSEKIAIHHQKQAEETAAFEQIMNEVRGATRVGTCDLVSNQLPTNQSTVGRQVESNQHVNLYQIQAGGPHVRNKHHLHISQNMGNLRAGSLPNVNQVGTATDAEKSGVDLRTALNNLADIRCGRDPHRERRQSPSSFGHERFRSPNHYHTATHRQDGKRIDASPYATVYLSPPPDSSWRRTNSDSALHQTIMMSDQEDDAFPSGSSPRRSTTGSSSINSSMAWDPGKKFYNHILNQQMLSASLPTDARPKSCEVPGIAIYPTQEDPNTVHHHIPISSNTGSLPDLTNLHFPAPLSTPIDIEDQNLTTSPTSIHPNHQTSSSPYASPGPGDPSSPYTPPSPYSPNSPLSNTILSPPPNLANQRVDISLLSQLGVQCNGAGNSNGMVNMVSGNGTPSPGPSPPAVSMATTHEQPQLASMITNSCSDSHSPDGQHYIQPQQDHVCYHYDSNSHTGTTITMEGLAVDTNALSLDGQQQTAARPDVFNFTTATQHHPVSQVQDCINPQAQLQQISLNRHRSTTPSEHSCSAPTSPVSHSISPLNSPDVPHNSAASLSKTTFTDNLYYNVHQTNVLQHQLEQFKMVTGTNEVHPNPSDQYLMMSENSNRAVYSNVTDNQASGLYYTDNKTLPQSPVTSLAENSSGMDNYSSQESPQSVVSVNREEQGNTMYFANVSREDGVNATVDERLLVQTTSPLIYSKNMISSTSYQTTETTSTVVVGNQSPKTPTSIPNIVLTGPNVEEGLRNQDFTKEIGTAMASMSGHVFDTNDLFSSTEEYPIDFDGLQILTDMTEGTSEDGFRLEQ